MGNLKFVKGYVPISVTGNILSADQASSFMNEIYFKVLRHMSPFPLSGPDPKEKQTFNTTFIL